MRRGNINRRFLESLSYSSCSTTIANIWLLALVNAVSGTGQAGSVGHQQGQVPLLNEEWQFCKTQHSLAHIDRLHVAGDLKKAKEAGYNTCESMLMQPKRVRMPQLEHIDSMLVMFLVLHTRHPLPQKLFEIKGLSEAKVEKMLDAAKKSCPNFGIMSAKDFEVQVWP